MAYEALITALRKGAYAPGDRLREEEVGERLGLSRTPVREALRRLEAHGIGEHRPRIGAVIRTLNHTEIVEFYELRIVLERTREDPVQSSVINQDFHRHIYLAGRNRFLLDAARALNNSMLLIGPTTYTDPDRVDVVVNEHNSIIKALSARDANAAGAAAEAHLQNSLRYRLELQAG